VRIKRDHPHGRLSRVVDAEVVQRAHCLAQPATRASLWHDRQPFWHRSLLRAAGPPPAPPAAPCRFGQSFLSRHANPLALEVGLLHPASGKGAGGTRWNPTPEGTSAIVKQVCSADG
jgi:hypothetical protein